MGMEAENRASRRLETLELGDDSKERYATSLGTLHEAPCPTRIGHTPAYLPERRPKRVIMCRADHGHPRHCSNAGLGSTNAMGDWISDCSCWVNRKGVSQMWTVAPVATGK